MCGNRVVKVVVVIASSFGAADGRGGEKKREKEETAKEQRERKREEGRERRRWRAGDRESDLFGRGWDSGELGRFAAFENGRVRSKSKGNGRAGNDCDWEDSRAVGRTSVLAVEPRSENPGRVRSRHGDLRRSRKRVGVDDVAESSGGGDLRVLSHSRDFGRRLL